MEKKLIELARRYVDDSYLEGCVSSIAKCLSILESDFKDEVETDWDTSLPLETKIIIKLEKEYYGCDEGKEFHLKAYREETDDEFKLRLDAKQAQEDKVRERELQTLAKLKAKYGDVS